MSNAAPKKGRGRSPGPTTSIVIEKANIPKALREQVWITYADRCFQRKCLVPWCQNTMTVFDFHVGHDVPESHGGATEIRNLRPICARCNLSMGSQYSVQEWSRLSAPKRTWFQWFTCSWPSASASSSVENPAHQ
jgi:5-methylcytosine-specific restriction endonuclease McrA